MKEDMKLDMKLDMLIQATDAVCLSQFQVEFSSVGSDSRSQLNNKIFFALRGDHHDAHQFLNMAFENGAGCLVIDKDLEPTQIKLLNKVSIVKVSDTLLALQKFAQFWKTQMNAKILALTGSNGKTTTKEFASTLIGHSKKCLKNKGSLNNHWGVPLTLLEIQKEHEIAIIEMGMNHHGELTRLVEIADPEVVLVTGVGQAHIGAFQNIEDVAKAKEEIYKACANKQCGIFNLDNPYTKKMYLSWKNQFQKTLTFSAHEPADIRMKWKGPGLLHGFILDFEFTNSVKVFGEHNLVNFMAAAALAITAGLKPEQIAEAFPECESTWGRNQILSHNGVNFVFDAYNANPESMGALIQNAKNFKTEGRKFGVFAQMRELGHQSQVLHQELGRKVLDADFDFVCFYGEDVQFFQEAFLQKSFSQENADRFLGMSDYDEEKLKDFAKKFKNGDWVFLKGSRSMMLERFLSLYGVQNKPASAKQTSAKQTKLKFETKRLDLILVERNFARSRSQAQDLIESGWVLVNQKVSKKSNLLISADDDIQVLETPLTKYVSRAGLKLDRALEHLSIHPVDFQVLDIGQSTGGFSDCVLQKGAKFVLGIDVGHDQLSKALWVHPRLKSIQGLHIKDLHSSAHYLEYQSVNWDLIVVDVSFISLVNVISFLLPLMSEKTRLLALVKPQFELGPKALNKKGLVKNKKDLDFVKSKICKFALDLELQILDYFPCALVGSDGNQEFFIYLRRDMV